jgi:DNA-binding NtrC family response regulator
MMDGTHASLIRRLQETCGLAKLVGEAPGFLKAISHLPAAAKSDATVLISGETGTGKELVARAIHYLSERAAFPFVAVNCGAVTDTLMEDELFGHERGAFTDARHHRPGLFAQAEKGTLFLDEIEALTGHGQVMLLRVLQDQLFRPLGSSQERQANVRFIAATNAALSPRVQHGSFRADLYYRLCVFRISLPPLRERTEDILRLAAHFLRKHAAPDRAPLDFSPAARAALLAFDWPGNVRELENAVIRALWICPTNAIEVEDLALPGFAATGSPPTADATPRTYRALKRLAIEAFEWDYLNRLMQEHRGNVTRAARTAGKDRRELGKLLKKYHFNPKRFAAAAPDAATGENPPALA